MPHNELIKVHGLAVPYNSKNEFNEVIKPGAFDRFLDQVPVLPMKIQHMGEAVGKWTKFDDRGDGLYVEGVLSLPFKSWKPDVLKKGLLPELSICFITINPWRYDTRLRASSRPRVHEETRLVDKLIVKEAALTEISLVTGGAFDGTWVKRLDNT